jgi:hypothetical protein
LSLGVWRCTSGQPFSLTGGVVPPRLGAQRQSVVERALGSVAVLAQAVWRSRHGWREQCDQTRFVRTSWPNNSVGIDLAPCSHQAAREWCGSSPLGVLPKHQAPASSHAGYSHVCSLSYARGRSK